VLRIIAGEFRRRTLATPPDAEVTRPIPDRVKESLFGLLRGHTEDATVFDGFAGVGPIGLEALSRGASRVLFVEQNRHIAALLKQNIESLGAEDRCEVAIGDALGPGALARAPRPLKLAFLDPPFPLMEDPAGFRRVMTQLSRLIDLLADDGYAVLRAPHPLTHRVGEAPVSDAAPVRVFRKKGKERDDWKQEMRRSPRDGRGPRQPRADGEEDAVELSEDEIARAMRGETLDDAAEATEAAPAPAGERVAPDLHLPNAVGPETHVYRNMSVHLYMKKR